MTQITLEQAISERDAAVEQVSKAAGEAFRSQACDFISAYLLLHGPTSGEVLTDQCKQSGIVPHDDRAFGAVYLTLAKRGIIRKVGACLRRKGHATSGGNVWGLTGNSGSE